MIICDKDQAALDQFSKENPEVMTMKTDVSDEKEVLSLFDEIKNNFGDINALINNAGVAGPSAKLEDTNFDDWQNTLNVNLNGAFLCSKAAIPLLKLTGGGSIINISSVSGLIGGHNLAAYNASKGAVRLLTKSVALYCARQGYNIRCNSVHPTFIDTPMVRSMINNAPDPGRVEQKLARQVPLQHIGEPDDIAWGVVYLASNESKFMTGSEFVVDGGITAM